MADVSRPLGLSERFSLTRSLIGTQPTPIFAAVISLFVDDSRTLDQDVLAIVPSLVDTHPNLFATILGPQTRNPRLGWLHELETRPSVIALAATELDEALLEATAIKLDVLDNSQPLWRVVYGRLSSKNVLVGFVGHHTLFDGSAILAVGRTLVANFVVDVQRAPPPVKIALPSPAPTLHPSLESIMTVKPSTITLLGTVIKELLVPRLPTVFQRLLPQPEIYWAGLKDAPSLRTRQHRTLHVSVDRVKALLAACRDHGVSMTSLIHAAVASSVRPTAEGLPLKSITNVDARQLFERKTPSGVGTYVGAVHTISPGTTNESVWDEARAYHARLRASSTLYDSVKVVGMLAYVPDDDTPDGRTGWEAFFDAQTQKPKDMSFEISNLGRASFGKEATQGGRSLKHAVFSQAPLPSFPALVVSILSCETGMELCVGWEKEVVDAEPILAALEETLATVA